MTDVKLGPLTDALRTRIVEHGWLDDLAANRARGLPGGVEGRMQARTELLEALETPSAGLLGVYRDLEPVGMMTVEEGAPNTRTIEVWLYVDPEVRREGVGTEAMESLLEYTFSGESNTYRVEVRLLQVKGGVAVAQQFLKSLGFTLECSKKAAIWVGDSCLNQHIFRLLKYDWKQGRKRPKKEEAA